MKKKSQCTIPIISFLLAGVVWIVTKTDTNAHDVDVHSAISIFSLSQSSAETFLGNAGFSSETVLRWPYPVLPPSDYAPFSQNSVILPGRTARDWVADGSIFEDAPYRYANHFCDPTKNPRRRLTDETELALPPSRTDSWTWARSRNAAGTSGPNAYSWQNARDYQYQAVTAAAPATREEYLAKTYFSLGHVIHLLQDLSQPGHVRNDEHKSKRYIESYGKRDGNAGRILSDPNLSALPWRACGFTRLQDFWDRDMYHEDSQPLEDDANGTDLTKTLGLAEFTNGNLLSEDALYHGMILNHFELHNYAYPDLWSSTNYNSIVTHHNLTTVILPDQTAAVRIYLQKTVDGIRMQHHAALGFLGLKSIQKLGRVMNVGISINDPIVLEEYHQVMLKKAIAYSAGCLDYFFRGSLRVDIWRRPGESFFRLAVSNWSRGPLVGGKFELFWDDAVGNRTKIKEWENTSLPSWSLGPGPLGVYARTTFEKPPGLSAKSFLLVYRGTVNVNATAAADPVDEGIAIIAVRLDPPVGAYIPTSIQFAGVQPGPHTTSYPINATFPLTEEVFANSDPNDPPTVGFNYSFKSPIFRTSQVYGDGDTGWSDLAIYLTWINRGWLVSSYNGFYHTTGLHLPGFEPEDLGGGRLRIRNFYGTRPETEYPPSAGNGTAVVTFQ